MVTQHNSAVWPVPYASAQPYHPGTHITPGFAMLMSPNKDETAVHGCHCPGDMAVRMRKVLAIPRSCAV